MRRCAFLIPISLVLSSCHEPVAPAAPALAAPAPANTAGKKEAPAKPAPAPAPKTGELTSIQIEAFFPRQQAGTALIYDARPGFVSGFGKIPGAISWSRGDYEKLLPLHEPEIRQAKATGKIVVIYCTDAACPDARAVAEKLVARGHDVSILEGGYATWKDAGMPTE